MYKKRNITFSYQETEPVKKNDTPSPRPVRIDN